MFLCKIRQKKTELLFFMALNSFLISKGYGQSTPPSKSKTQEVNSIMQESHVIKAFKAQKSTTSVATCDPDGDDSHCPPITPEKNQFFIRTGTQMSCANSGAATFLQNNKLSHLSVEAHDIIDQRSTASSLFNKNRSRESREKFSGAARVKVSLVAWTTATSGSEEYYLDFERYRSDDFHRSRRGYFGFPSKHKDLIVLRAGSKSHLLWTYYGDQLRMAQTSPHAWLPYSSLLVRVMQNRFIEHFKTRQSGYKELDHDGLKKSKRKGNILTKYQPVGLTVLPPLSRQVHTIAYDDKVMANAGDALLRCVNEGTEDAPSFFDADLDAHEKVCLSESQWREMKKTATPAELAAHNKKLLYIYFKHVYGNQDKYEAWKGVSVETAPNYYINFYKENMIAFSNYFAVQSCQNYAQDTEHQTELKTAHQIIKKIKDEVENVRQLLSNGEKLTKENTELYRLFDQYGDHNYDEGTQTPAVFNGKKALAESVFYWAFLSFKRMKERYAQIIAEAEAGLETWVDTGDTSKLVKLGVDLQSTYYGRTDDTYKRMDYLRTYLRVAPHCFSIKRSIKSRLLPIVRSESHESEDSAKWWLYSSGERDLLFSLSAYIPKWWEHTDLGFACRLISQGINLKNIVIPKLHSTQDWRGYFFKLDDHGTIVTGHYNRATIRDMIDKVKRDASELEKLLELLKAAAGLEVLEAKYQHYGPKNKACSPDTGTYKIKENKTPPDPAWHKVYSSAILDMRQNLDASVSEPFKIFSSQHPSEGFSTDLVKQHLMTKDSHYLTFYSSNPDLEENYHPGLPMIMVPGTPYIAPEVVADESSTPPRGYSGKYGISVYSYPPAVCNLTTTQHRGIKRPHRIWN